MNHMDSFFIEDGDGIIIYNETPVENIKIGDLIDIQPLPGGYDILHSAHTDSLYPFSIISIEDTEKVRLVEVQSDYCDSHTFEIPHGSTVYLIDYDENG